MIPKCHCQANGNTLVEQLVYVSRHNLVQKMTNFSDYIVYVDESGDHNLVSIDRNFPVFALSFCILPKKSTLTVSFQKLKNSSFAIGAMMLLFCTSATFANPLGISLSLVFTHLGSSSSRT